MRGGFGKINGRLVAMTDGSPFHVLRRRLLETEELLSWDDPLQRVDCAEIVKSWRMPSDGQQPMDPSQATASTIHSAGGEEASYNCSGFAKAPPARADGCIETTRRIQHAFSVTENYIVLPESPLVIDTRSRGVCQVGARCTGRPRHATARHPRATGHGAQLRSIRSS